MKRRHLNRFQLRRLRRASRRTRALLVSSGAAVAIVATLPVLSGRTVPRWYALESARQAFAHAQNSGAETWAAGDFRRARAALQVGMVEHRHQELRFLLLRDFSHAQVLLTDAERLAHDAAQAAAQGRGSARTTAREAITRAAQAVGRGVAFADAMHLAGFDRAALQKSRIQLAEAEILHERGMYDLAAQRARTASLQADRIADRAARAASRYTDTELVQNWRQWMQDTIEWSKRSGGTAIVVQKDKHLVTLYAGGRAVKSYSAELGYNSIGNKHRAGDSATPEGRYRITAKKDVGQSGYHMALLLDYPNDQDRRRFAAAKRAGRIPKHASLGNLIEIHGDGGRGKDWTKGCVALTNRDIGDLFDRVHVGTPVTIVGGDGNGGTFTRLVGLQRTEPSSGTN
jgi:lipoprotein-anchoring transpeptidase ErfK/SrfK